MEKKKNFIIPGTHFNQKEVAIAKEALPSTTLAEKQAVYATPKEEQIPPKKEPVVGREEAASKTLGKNPKEDGVLKETYVSGFSLSSVSLKKSITKKDSEELGSKELPSELFTEEALVAVWKTYAMEKRKQGESNLAAILEMDVPKLKEGFKIIFEVANQMNEKELMREMEHFMPLLKEQLKNHSIRLEIRVKEQEQLKEEYAYSVRDKFELLLKSNPALETFRKEFDLDI